MTTDRATAGPKHRSPKRRWWQRAEDPAPEPVWVPGWASDWHVVDTGPATGRQDAG
ncbi:MAG: hypothetical protein ACJ72L_11415 [Marmoricola sp.]